MKITKDFKGLVDIGWAYEFQGDINSDESIEIDLGPKWLKVTGNIRSKLNIFNAGSGIKAGWGIEAGEGIKAGWGIEAGEGIKAGWGINAGSGIEAGLSISCKLSLSFKYALFAGICHWRKIEDSEKTVTCGKFEPIDGAKIEYGILKVIEQV